MIRLFSVNRTDDPSNTEWDQEVFVVKRLSQEKRQRVKEHYIRITELLDMARTPVTDYVLQGIFAVGCIIAGLFSKMLDSRLFAGFSCGFLIAFLLVKLNRRRLQRNVIGSEYVREQLEKYTECEASCYDEMEYPEDCYDMDIMSEIYEIENVNGYTRKVSAIRTNYSNECMRVYVKDHILYIGEKEQKAGIPISCIQSIEEVYEESTLDAWNKSESYNSRNFYPYRMVEDKNGDIMIHSYCQVRIQKEMVAYEMRIPSYEREVFENLIRNGCA